MEEQELFLDYRLEVEEDCPAACVSDQIGRQAAVEALDGLLFRDELFEDTKATDGCLGGVTVD